MGFCQCLEMGSKGSESGFWLVLTYFCTRKTHFMHFCQYTFDHHKGEKSAISARCLLSSYVQFSKETHQKVWRNIAHSARRNLSKILSRFWLSWFYQSRSWTHFSTSTKTIFNPLWGELKLVLWKELWAALTQHKSNSSECTWLERSSLWLQMRFDWSCSASFCCLKCLDVSNRAMPITDYAILND